MAQPQSEEKNGRALRIALPNGSLEKKTLELFEAAGLSIAVSSRSHRGEINDPLIEEVVFMRPQHIPRAIRQGVVNAGICGYDCVVEDGNRVEVIEKLPYSRSTSGPVQIVLVAPESNPIRVVAEIPDGATVSTEYPQLTARFFANEGKNVDSDFSYGSTEANVAIGLFDYGVCLTETGTSLAANGLKVVAVLLESTTALVANRAIDRDHPKYSSLTDLRRLLAGALAARENVMLVMNVPTDKIKRVLEVLPSLKGPTIAPLSEEGYVSISTVVRQDSVNEVFLKALEGGAEDVVKIPISQMIRHR